MQDIKLDSLMPPDIEKVEMEEGDYVAEDGLIHCGKCHGKKQTRLPASAFTGGREMIVHCICQCQVEANKRRKEEEERRKAMERIERLKSASLIDDKLSNARLCTFQKNADNQKVYALAERYVEKFDEMYQKRQGLLFWGTVVMTSFVKILQNIQGNQGEERVLMSRLNDARLLIIDDLGTERNTDYALEKVYNIIDSRYRVEKPLILTTNMTVREMQENTDTRYKRIYDRIFEMCTPVRVPGRSWREKEAARRFDEIKKLMEE